MLKSKRQRIEDAGWHLQFLEKQVIATKKSLTITEDSIINLYNKLKNL